jgi:hypothetical protein
MGPGVKDRLGNRPSLYTPLHKRKRKVTHGSDAP